MSKDDRFHTTSWDGCQIRRTPEPAQSQSGSKAAPAKKRKKKVRRRMNPFLALILWVVFVGVSSLILAGVGWLLANDMCALNKTALSATVEIDESYVDRTEQVDSGGGETRTVTYYNMEKVAQTLHEKGLVDYPWFFRLFSWAYKGEQKMAQGIFELNTDMDYMALIRAMRPSGGKAVTVDISIPEGYTVRQIIDLLAENGVGSVEDLTDAAANYVFEDYAFVNNTQLGSISRLEGYLYPDTYNFYVGGRPEVALNSMLSNFDRKVYSNPDLADLFGESPHEMSDIITIASLIEKETDGSDRGNIASVIYNRLATAGETAYLLQIDAALVYAAGREITQEDYANLDSPYNLYTHTGLPPTPIANPGLASIKAALQPSETGYFFYVLGPDGKHIFNETLSGHQKAIASLG